MTLLMLILAFQKIKLEESRINFFGEFYKKGCLFSHFYKHKILKPCTISSIYRSLRFMRKESWNGARRKAIKAMDKFVF